MFFAKHNWQNRKIASFGKDLQPEEVFWDAALQKQEEKIFKKKLEVPLTPKAVFGMFVVFMLITFFAGAKTFQFQVMEHDKYLSLAQRNKFAISSLQAQRGVIYDKNFNQLVVNKPSYDLVFRESEFSKEETVQKEALEKVAWILGLETKALEEKIFESSAEKIIVVADLDYKKLILIESNLQNLAGFSVEDSGIREYLEGPIFSHVLGYHRKSGQNAGLEASYNHILSPKPGKVVTERDVYGTTLNQEALSSPEPGKSLKLHLDADLQKVLYQVMKEEMEKGGVERGAAVALDPRTGGVLAMVSFPSYDNNIFSLGITQESWDALIADKNLPFLNRVIAGSYPTGSTIKPLIAAAALEEELISKSTAFDCKGHITIESPWDEEIQFIYRDWAVHGITSVKEAIAKSCNVFFYTIGGGYKDFEGLGAEKIKEYLEYFGWNQKLGIDLPGEKSGFIPDRQWKRERFSSPDNLWMPGDTYHLSIGQGFLGATPLAVASSFAAIANGGTLLSPRIVQEVIDEERNVLETINIEEIKKDFINQEALEVVRQGMREAVEYGSAVALNNLPQPAAAKTGTAEIGKKGYYHNWIGVFAPYQDPEIVLVTMVEEGHGMRIAVIPTVYRVLDWYFGERERQDSKTSQEEFEPEEEAEL